MFTFIIFHFLVFCFCFVLPSFFPFVYFFSFIFPPFLVCTGMCKKKGCDEGLCRNVCLYNWARFHPWPYWWYWNRAKSLWWCSWWQLLNCGVLIWRWFAYSRYSKETAKRSWFKSKLPLGVWSHKADCFGVCLKRLIALNLFLIMWTRSQVLQAGEIYCASLLFVVVS